VSGTIYDPAGKHALYGVGAYIPAGQILPIAHGISCSPCQAPYSGQPVTSAISDAQGRFTLSHAPDGPNVPLVIQVGKWRRQFTVPSVARCENNIVPDGTLTLPKKGSEGDMPDIAISTGGADTLECLLRRVGIEAGEYVAGAGSAGHVHIFQGAGGNTTNPAAPTSDKALWDSALDLSNYDLVILSCEGAETNAMNQQALFSYAAGGGRVLASHFHYAWFNTGPFAAFNLATWMTGNQDIGNINATVVLTKWGGQSFARGQALHDWLAGTGVLANDQFPITAAKGNASVSMANTPSQPWLVATTSAAQNQLFTFDAPLTPDAGPACGRVAFTDMHVGAAAGDYATTTTTPDGCAGNGLTAQEQAMEYFLFDLSSCVTPDNSPFAPP
jgi:hypothetical protein